MPNSCLRTRQKFDLEWEGESEDCWGKCGKKPGKCSECGEGFCCSHTRTDINGDCPAEAVQYLKDTAEDNFWKEGGHVCVKPAQKSNDEKAEDAETDDGRLL